MCCDMVDVMLDVSSIYGYPTENDSNGAIGEKITVQGDSGGLGLQVMLISIPSHLEVILRRN